MTDEPHELRVVEDARRDVHAHAEVEAVAVPHRGREERFAYDPRLDVADETFALRGRDEIERRDEATLGVVPAQKGLDAAHLLGLDEDPRLVVQDELVLDDRALELEADRGHVSGGSAPRPPCSQRVPLGAARPRCA